MNDNTTITQASSPEDAISDQGVSPVNQLLAKLAQLKKGSKPTPGAFGGKRRNNGVRGWKREKHDNK